MPYLHIIVGRNETSEEVDVVMRIKGSRNRAKPAEAVTSRATLAEQTAAFLKQGGEIKEVPRGKSGQQQVSYFRRSTPATRKPATPPETVSKPAAKS